MHLHPNLDGYGRKGVLTRVVGGSAVALSVEGVGRLKVEEVLPSSVPMLHKGGTSVRLTAERHTGNRRRGGWLSPVVVVGGCKMRW
jgi:hypothetical protein